MKKPDLYKFTIIILIIAILVATGALIFNFSKGKMGKVAVKVDSLYGKASVKINGEDRGQTPVNYADVKTTNVEVEMNGDLNSYKTTINPSANTMVVVIRDLGISDVFRSGSNTWLTKTGRDDALLSFVSPNLDDVSIVIDGVEVGKAPVKVSTKSLLNHKDDETYNVEYKKDGYESLQTTLKARAGYEVTVSVDLFLEPIRPVNGELEGLPEGVSFYSFTNYDNAGYTNKQDWAKAINYWLSTRGSQTLGNTANVSKFDYFIDDNGKIYNDTGNEINATDVKLEDGTLVAYLGSSHEEGLSDDANKVVAQILGKEVDITNSEKEGVSVKDQVKIKPNSLGFLRVRSGAGRSNSEVAQVKVGETFDILEESNGWYKIEYEPGKEGWISGSSQYTEKIEAKGAQDSDTEDTENAGDNKNNENPNGAHDETNKDAGT